MSVAEETKEFLVDYEKLTVAQQLVIEVLIARYRLGETLWTFGTNATSTLYSLQKLGVINVMSGNVQGTLRASLTDDALKAYITKDYIPPIIRESRFSEITYGNEELVLAAQKVRAATLKALEQSPEGIIFNELSEKVSLSTRFGRSWIDTVLVALMSDEVVDQRDYKAGEDFRYSKVYLVS